MLILFLFVSFVSFRQCKVMTILGRFQEKSQILLKLVWTNEQSLDKSQKWAKKLSKGVLFALGLQLSGGCTEVL